MVSSQLLHVDHVGQLASLITYYLGKQTTLMRKISEQTTLSYRLL